jgi:CAAX protease family protein
MEWLVAGVGVTIVALQIWQDRTTYPRFKAMTETADRQRMYRYWVIDGFIRYGVLGVLGLFVLTRQDTLWAMPGDIAHARDALAGQLGFESASLQEAATVVTVALCVGLLIGALIPFVLWRKKKVKVVVVSDTAALLPRNGAEIRLAALLSLNAGLGEEIFFRLALPLAFYAIVPDLAMAFGAAAFLFGVGHAYQGPIGIAATFAVGLLMTALYLASGQIWLVIALHALIDLRSLVFLPLALKRAGA